MRLRNRSGRAVLGDVANTNKRADPPPATKPVSKRSKPNASSSSSSSTTSVLEGSSSTTSALPPQPPSQAVSTSSTSSLAALPPPLLSTTTTTTSKAVTRRHHASSSSSSSTAVIPPAPYGSLHHQFPIIPRNHFMRNPLKLDHTLDVAPVDVQDLADPLRAAEYISDMMQNLYTAQKTHHPGCYMEGQKDINSKMRAILVDWLIEVHMKFKLVPETLYLTINVIDRYCSQSSIPRSKLQLVGVTALLIACKYEEIYPPEVRDCVYITDNAYSRQEVLDMEQSMLKLLEFRITVPTSLGFLMRFLKVVKATHNVKLSAHYYCERTLQEHDMLRYDPSLVATASVHLALNNNSVLEIGKDVETCGYCSTLKDYTGYTMQEVEDCASLIAKKVSEEPVTASRRQLVAVKKKYANEKYGKVSEIFEGPRSLRMKADDKAREAL